VHSLFQIVSSFCENGSYIPFILKYRISTEPEVAKQLKYSSFILQVFFKGLFKIANSITGFRMKQQHLHQVVQQLISQCSKDTLKYGFIWVCYLYMYTCTKWSHDKQYTFPLQGTVVSTAGCMTKEMTAC